MPNYITADTTLIVKKRNNTMFQEVVNRYGSIIDKIVKLNGLSEHVAQTHKQSFVNLIKSGQMTAARGFLECAREILRQREERTRAR